MKMQTGVTNFETKSTSQILKKSPPTQHHNKHHIKNGSITVNHFHRYRGSRHVSSDSLHYPRALPVADAINNDNATTELPSKATTPSIESLLPSKIIPSLPPHLRGLTTTTAMPYIFFNNSFISNLTAQLGQSVFLPCRTRHSSDRKVSLAVITNSHAYLSFILGNASRDETCTNLCQPDLVAFTGNQQACDGQSFFKNIL